MDDNEVELVRSCLSGDEPSLREFVQRFQGLVFGLCVRMLRHREDAEDVAQEVFLRVFRNLDRWDQQRPLKPWLLTITGNRCRTALEKRSRQRMPPEFAADLASDLASENRSNDAIDFAEELQLALDRLRADYKTCFILFYEQELGCAEISEIMGCPQGTIKTWLHRARHELADYLKRRGLVAEVNNELHRI